MILLALTPGLESLAPEQTESGIKPVGTGEGEGSGPRVTEGQEPEQDDTEQSEDPDNTPDGGQRTGLLAKPAFWILLIAGILLLFVLFILIRHHIILKNRQKTFENPDNSESISSLFSDAAKLLSALGFDRRGGSMLALYDPFSGQFGEETANAFRATQRGADPPGSGGRQYFPAPAAVRDFTPVSAALSADPGQAHRSAGKPG